MGGTQKPNTCYMSTSHMKRFYYFILFKQKIKKGFAKQNLTLLITWLMGSNKVDSKPSPSLGENLVPHRRPTFVKSESIIKITEMWRRPLNFVITKKYF